MSSGDWINYSFQDITINFDKMRRPLSSKEREKMQGKYPYYGAQGIIDRINNFIFDGTYMLIAEDGENLKSKKQNIAQLAHGQFWVNNHAHIVTSNHLSDIRFLCYLFNNTDVTGYITGSAQPKLSQANLNSIKVTVPPLPEQKAIADTLSCLDDKIELNNRINKTLEEMAQAIFRSWFVYFEPFQDGEFEDSELGRIPRGWRVGTLDECIDFYNGYAFKSQELLDCEVQESYHVFKMGHIKKGGGLNPEGTKSWIEKSKCEDLLKYVLKTGDLLMCMTDMKGNVALLGHTALMNESDKYIINQRVGLLRANSNFGVGFPYLYILTNTNDFIENLRGRANSGVQVNLSTSEIKTSKIVIAPKEINTKYNQAVMPMFDKMFKIVKENQTLTAIRDTLLPKLMSGEIRVPIEEAQ